jgi:cell division inhibitor SulA
MPRFNTHGHRPAFTLDPSTRPSAVPTHRETGASSSATALEVGVETIDQGFIPLKIHRPNSAESALRAQAKELTQKKIKVKSMPYTSTSGDPEVQLNCRVTLRPSDLSTLVACRHLSQVFAEHSGKKSELMDGFSTEAVIKTKFDGKLDQTDQAYLEALRTAPPGCQHIVNSEHLGDYLKAMALQLEAAGRTSSLSQANCLLVTLTHAMALHVERKSQNGVAYFSAKVYDPNATASYRRVVKATPDDFAGLNLKDMLIKPQNINLYSLGGGEQLSMVAVSLDKRLQPQKSEMKIEHSVENMVLAFRFGLPEEMHAMLETALKKVQEPDQSFALLEAIDSVNGAPGLSVALRCGNSNVIDVFTERILESDRLTSNDKIELLSATKEGNLPGLYLAFWNGHSDAIDVFTKRVLESSNLTPEDKLSLLTSHPYVDTPGLYLALECGNTHVVDAFARRVLESDKLTLEDKIHLLSAKGNDGRPGLAKAFHSGNSDAIDVFSQRILESKNLTSNSKIELLSATNASGITGLGTAFHAGHSDAIDVFTKRVLESSNLTREDKVELLSAKDEIAPPGLVASFVIGNAEVIDVFTKRVLESEDLTPDDKLALLSNNPSDGTPGLAMAFQLGNSEAIDVFTQRILESDSLTEERKMHLLAAQNPDGTPGLSSALDHEESDAVNVFAKRIWESDKLTLENKLVLLASMDLSGVPGLAPIHRT